MADHVAKERYVYEHEVQPPVVSRPGRPALRVSHGRRADQTGNQSGQRVAP
jgi:hypothetical protein